MTHGVAVTAAGVGRSRHGPSVTAAAAAAFIIVIIIIILHHFNPGLYIHGRAGYVPTTYM